MPQTVSSEAVIMPEPSDKSSSDSSSPADPSPANSPHRSEQRTSSGEGLTLVEKPIANAPATEVFAIFGAEPEIQAYAMAKYSRSALSMKESLREISSQKAEKFLNTFYFQ